MRTIEFRGRGFDSIKWEYGDLLQYDDGDVCIGVHSKNYTDDGFNAGLYRHIVSVDEDTVGQFTGLKDKKGNKIYEDDILLDESGAYAVVCYSMGSFCVDFGEGFDLQYFTDRIHEICYVAGNIHDNPELLKGGEQ